MPTVSPTTGTASLWHYNATLLRQSITLIQKLQCQASPGFVYAQAVGPHLRHIIEHYQALMQALGDNGVCIDYDARRRDLRMQTDPEATIAALQTLINSMEASMPGSGLALDTPMKTRLQAGTSGEFELQVATTLGRELLFVASHTVHHYALLGHYCRAAGVEPGQDFGKAPATVAFEHSRAVAAA